MHNYWVDLGGLFKYNNFVWIPMLRITHDVLCCIQRGGKLMEIRVGENESLESALKRFKRKTARSGILAEVRRREHYEKPSVKRKKKAEAARKRKY